MGIGRRTEETGTLPVLSHFIQQGHLGGTMKNQQPCKEDNAIPIRKVHLILGISCKEVLNALICDKDDLSLPAWKLSGHTFHPVKPEEFQKFAPKESSVFSGLFIKDLLHPDRGIDNSIEIKFTDLPTVFTTREAVQTYCQQRSGKVAEHLQRLQKALEEAEHEGDPDLREANVKMLKLGIRLHKKHYGNAESEPDWDPILTDEERKALAEGPEIVQPADLTITDLDNGENIFRQTGDYWTVGYNGNHVKGLKNISGFRLIQILIKRYMEKAEAIYVEDLYHEAKGRPEIIRSVFEDMNAEQLKSEGVNAEMRIQAEKARKNISNNIENALKRIKKHDSICWWHLKNSIKNEYYRFFYSPETPTTWKF